MWSGITVVLSSIKTDSPERAGMQCMGLLCIFLPLFWVWFRGTLEGIIRIGQGDVRIRNFRQLFKLFTCLLVACLGSCWIGSTAYLVKAFAAEGVHWLLKSVTGMILSLIYWTLLYLAVQFYKGLRAEVVAVTGP